MIIVKASMKEKLMNKQIQIDIYSRGTHLILYLTSVLRWSGAIYL